MWTLSFDAKPPNLNDHLVNRGGRNRSAYAAQSAVYGKVRDGWISRIIVEMRNQGIPDATGPMRVEYTRIMGKREREWDFDNLVGGGKIIFDAMVRARLIVDDSPRLCERHYEQVRGPVTGLRLRVSALESGASK